MIVRWLLAVALLPGMVLAAVPLAILLLTSRAGAPFTISHPGDIQFWLALIAAIPGSVLSAWTTSLFFRYGEGTAAPWDPPKRFLVRGPYRHLRNPMILGVGLLLIAESIFFQSWVLAVWAVVFLAGNAIYIPLVEEPGLRKRFGDDYAVYCKNVRRWIPRIQPWRLESGNQTANHG